VETRTPWTKRLRIVRSCSPASTSQPTARSTCGQRMKLSRVRPAPGSGAAHACLVSLGLIRRLLVERVLDVACGTGNAAIAAAAADICAAAIAVGHGRSRT